MGQRLTITIKENEKKLASCYWHWSGFTGPAIQLLDKVMQAIKGKRFTTEEMAKAFIEVGASFNGSRNNGLIAVTEEDINRQEEWGETHITVDPANEIIDFNVFYQYDEKEAKERLLPPPCTTIKTILNPREIGFPNFGEFYTMVAIVAKFGYLFETPTGSYEAIW